MDETHFLILFRSEAGARLARIVIESLRAFGGLLADCPVWAFCPIRNPYPIPWLA